MTFFADENFTIHGVRLLEAFDLQNEIRHLTDSFDKGTPDVEWLGGVSTWIPKPIVVGGDGRILRNKVERQALRDADLSFVYLAPGWTNLRWQDMAWKLVRIWPDVVKNVERSRQATVFEIKTTSLKVELRGTTRNL